MVTTYDCRSCGGEIRLPAGAGGKKCKCASCGTIHRISEIEDDESYELEIVESLPAPVEPSNQDEATPAPERRSRPRVASRRSRARPQDHDDDSGPAPGRDARLAIFAVATPAVAGLVMAIIASPTVGNIVSVAAVITSSMLLYFDNEKLKKIVMARNRAEGRSGRRPSSYLNVAGLLIIWLVFFPIALASRRKKYGGPALVIPAIIAILFLFGGGIVGVLRSDEFQAIYRESLVQALELPAADSPEVIRLLDQLITQHTNQLTRSTEHIQTAYLESPPTRQCACTVMQEGEKVRYQYAVTWLDREKAIFHLALFKR